MIDEEVKEWLKKADSDFKLVEHELRLPEEEVIRDIVCFHCQQAVEKYLKAFLVYNKKKVKRTHDIAYLLNECSFIDKGFASIEIKKLSTFGVDIRYPDDFYVPDMEEVKFYYDLTKRVKGLVLAKLGVKDV